MKKFKLDWLVLPLAGMFVITLLWQISSHTWAKELPSPAKTWEASKLYILEPLAKRGEMDQGILRFTWYSLVLVAKGYALALVLGTPIGFLLGVSNVFAKTFDPLIQILRPVSPLAWLPLGLVLFFELWQTGFGNGSTFYDCGVCDVADGPEYGGGGAGGAAGLFERGTRAETFAFADAL